MKRLPFIGEYDSQTHFESQHGPHFRIPQIWLTLLNPVDALVLSYLVNRRRIHKHAKELQPGGWFYCTRATMQRALGLKKDAQARSLRRLVLCEFLKLKYEPPPNGTGRSVRWIQVKQRNVHLRMSQIADGIDPQPPRDWIKATAKGDSHKRIGKFRKKSRKRIAC